MSGAVPGYVPTTGSGATTSDDQQQQQQYAAYDSSQHVSNESAYHHHQQQQQYYPYQAASSSHYDTSSAAAQATSHHHHYYPQQQNHEQQHYYATPTSHLTPSSESYDDSSALATPHLNDIGGLQDTFLNYHHQQQQQPVSLPSMHATFGASLPKQEQLGRPQDKMAPVSNSYNTSLQTFEDPFATPTMKLNEQQQQQHQQLDQRRQGVRTTRDDDSFALENQPPTKRTRTLDTDQLQQQSYHDNIPQYDGTDSALSALANIKNNEFDDDEFGDDDEEEEKSEYGALNSDDDVEGDEETNISNFVLSQYEKVTRHKNKWKCTLKYGIMNLNEKDYLFQTATGDFQW